jgi:hypothetical protein
MNIKFEDLSTNDSNDILIRKMNHNMKMIQILLQQMQEAYSKINGHSVVMPDINGANTDHDSRYYTKPQIDAMLS